MRPLLAALLLVAAAAHAAHPLVTEDTGTQGTGKFQLEVNAESTRDRAGGVAVKGFQPAAVIAYGVLDNLDVQVGRPYLRQVTDPGGANTLVKGGMDTVIDLKWRFFERNDLSIGVKPSVTFATGNEQLGLGSGRTTIGTLLIATLEHKPFTVSAHAGWRHNSNNVGQRNRIMQLAAAASVKTSEETRFVLDLSRTTNPNPAEQTSIRYATIALMLSPREDLDLDIGVRRAIGRPALDHSLMFGATLRW